ncbi:MAG: gliding motility-associated C-terminal domain-containing protein, partial [Crocinitomicaceae bacterium]|nr:gliding motility-associated C-terminal domain-containing protein [Crocinitomicaceae bacterium]
INGSPELLSFANSGGTLSGQGINLAGEFDPSIGVGVYTINHAFGGLCPSQDSIIISVFDLPEINFTTDTLIGCSPLTVTFVNNNIQNGQTFLWSFGDGGQSNQGGAVQYDYTNSGTYDVSLEITSPEGCSNANTLNALIDVLPSPEAYFQYTQILSDSGSVIEFTDLSNGANGWIWDFGNGEVSNLSEPIVLFEPGYNASVGLTVTSINGCNDTYTSLIQTLDQFLLYVPNSFTPNGDGKNDVFTPKVRGADPGDYIFRIYNRWGEQVFETNQIGEGWDGSFNEAASDVQSGMYVWIIIMKRNENASKIQRSGHVNLLR